MGMAEMPFHIIMERDSVHMTKIMIHIRQVATTVQPLINRVVEVLGGGGVVDMPI